MGARKAVVAGFVACATACSSTQGTTNSYSEPDGHVADATRDVSTDATHDVLADATVVDAIAEGAVDASSSLDGDDAGCSSCDAGVGTCASGAGCNASFWACSVSEGIGLQACSLVCTCDAGSLECNQDCPPDAAPPADCVQDVACVPGVRCGGDPPVCLCDNTGHLQCPFGWDGGVSDQ
jgi:hypothetical protein